MPDIDISAKVKTTGGTLVLDLSRGTGYELMPGTMPDRSRRNTVVSSRDIEGGQLQQSVLDLAVWVQPLRVVGSSTAQVETRVQSLIDAVEAFAWLWEVTIDGHVRTYRAMPADVSVAAATHNLVQHKRVVELRIPVQPRTNEELA